MTHQIATETERAPSLSAASHEAMSLTATPTFPTSTLPTSPLPATPAAPSPVALSTAVPQRAATGDAPDGAAHGAGIGAPHGAVIGATIDATIGATIGAAIGADGVSGASRRLRAPCSPASPGEHGASRQCVTARRLGQRGAWPDLAAAHSTHGATNGAIHGATYGATNGARDGATHGAHHGATHGAPRGAFVGAGHGALHDAFFGARASSPHGAPHGARPDGARHASAHPAHPAPRAAPRVVRTPMREPVDAQAVIYRLEEAGRALLALPNSGYTTRMRLNTIDVVRSALEGYGWDAAHGDTPRLRAPVPDAARITRMDEALAWIPLIPQDRYVLRRIVGCRALVSPVTERNLYPWRRIAKLLGADHKAVQRWHAQGIDLIVGAVNALRS